jgi:uncharacterized DUF497 family protein
MVDALFEWDEAKAEANYQKHGVDFATAEDAFEDAFAIEKPDPRSEAYGEERVLLTGMANGVLLTVVYTERGESIRIISARRATKHEHDNSYVENSKD